MSRKASWQRRQRFQFAVRASEECLPSAQSRLHAESRATISSVFDTVEPDPLRWPRVHNEVAAYLDRFAWDAFVVLTIRNRSRAERAQPWKHDLPPASHDERLVAFRDAFMGRLSTINRQPVSWFAVEESDFGGGRPHLHLLLARIDGLSLDAVAQCWPYGNAKVYGYDRSRRVASYVSKELGASWWDMSQLLPPVRSNAQQPPTACKSEPRPW